VAETGVSLCRRVFSKTGLSVSERRTYGEDLRDYHLLLFFLAEDLLAFFLGERFDFLALDFFLAGMFG